MTRIKILPLDECIYDTDIETKTNNWIKWAEQQSMGGFSIRDIQMELSNPNLSYVMITYDCLNELEENK